jgi:uncharacterized DUF497 family protein
MTAIVYEDFEWDEQKNKENQTKHNISFEAAVQIFKGIVIEAPTKDLPNEKRVLTIGVLENKEIVVISTERKTRRRIISARRARINERKTYQKILEKDHV